VRAFSDVAFEVHLRSGRGAAIKVVDMRRPKTMNFFIFTPIDALFYLNAVMRSKKENAN
jgi:hypothetical protein